PVAAEPSTSDNSIDESRQDQVEEVAQPDQAQDDKPTTTVSADDEITASEQVNEPTTDAASLVEPFKKLGLKPAEKITLSAIALLFIGMTVWGIIWLKQKNNDAVAKDELELPVEGQFATITEFESFWQSPGDSPGIKLGAVVVPAANITLGEGSSSGALRVYFRNSKKDSIGDPITIAFKDGTFSNDSKSIEVSATDGFHLKGDFHAYQMDSSMAWEVEVLEAENSMVAGSGFKSIIKTTLSPAMR
ncbi:MAG: hypothetical protein KJO79_02225, partial [Verrucomicrobiae bacterium]|nr:hypothetical protein [Verrucomicrobiae bacterium]NNJ85970.1 hypothetical protein [Akkermansiaceae bacterium]